MSLTRPPRRRLTPVLAEDMADAWSSPRKSTGQVRFVVDREDPARPTTPPTPRLRNGTRLD